MLPKPQRLNLKKDFKWAASGKKTETKFLKFFIKMGENTSPRFGIAVSAKVFKKAVDRNRVKRLVAQAFQASAYRLPPTINIVALPKQSILNVKSGDVLLDLEEVFKDLKLFK